MSEQERVSLGVPQSVATPSPQAGEVGYRPPVDMVPLPSKGAVYPHEHPLHGLESVEIRSMTAVDEDILTSRALLKQGKAISSLLRNCITNKLIDPDQMLVGDRNALLVAIRITGYGSNYNVTVECPKCEEKSVKHEFNLLDLPIKRLGAQPLAVGQNQFAFRFPVSGKEVVFRLLTGSDERELTTILEKTRKAVGVGGIEHAVTTRLLFQILSIGGEASRDKLSNIIRALPARDARDLRAYVDEISPGIEMTSTFTCPSCNESAEVDVPMGTEFFWPS